MNGAVLAAIITAKTASTDKKYSDKDRQRFHSSIVTA